MGDAGRHGSGGNRRGGRFGEDLPFHGALRMLVSAGAVDNLRSGTALNHLACGMLERTASPPARAHHSNAALHRAEYRVSAAAAASLDRVRGGKAIRTSTLRANTRGAHILPAAYSRQAALRLRVSRVNVAKRGKRGMRRAASALRLASLLNANHSLSACGTAKTGSYGRGGCWCAAANASAASAAGSRISGDVSINRWV